MGPLLACILLSVMVSRAAAVSQQQVSATACVSASNGTSLVDALRNQTVTTIVLTSDYDVGHEFDPYDGARAHIDIKRNVTITGLPGSRPLWNLRFQRSVLELCANCTFTLADIAIAQERRGNGAQVDIFVGQPGSVLVTDHVYRVRPACTSTDSTLQLINKDQKRSTRFPLPGKDQRQVLGIVNATYQGVSYYNMVKLIDFAYDVPLSYQEGLGSAGGYTLLVKNTTRLCDHILSGGCLLIKSPDACVNDLIDELLAQEATRDDAHQHMVIAVAVAVVGGVAILAAIAGVLLWRRRRARRLTAKYLEPASTAKTASNTERGDAASQPLVEPLLDTTGWEVANVSTTPTLAQLQDCKIQLGVLLGAGSYGRVYRGSWAGREVAVKVIEHESAAAVDTEVQLMLSINHPNVVRAYHYVTYIHTLADTDSSYAGGGQLAGNGAPGSTRQQQQQQQQQRAAALAVTSRSSSAGGSVSGSGTSSGPMPPVFLGKVADGTDGVLDSSYTAVDVSALKQVLKLDEMQQQQLPAPSSDAAAGPPDVMPAAGCTPPAGGAGAAGVMPRSYLPDRDGWLTGSGRRSGWPGSMDSSGRGSGGVRGMQRSRTWLVQEYCDCGTLSSWVGNVLQDPSDIAQLLQLLQLLLDAARGVQHLHAKSIVHGDLNARNVLVCSTPSGGVTAKLADLGISRVIKQHSTHRTTNTVGTVSHMPPELLRYGRMSTAVDVYSFGVLMWELYTGQIAFKKLQYGQFFEHVVLRNTRPPIPPDMHEDYSLLVTSCWAIEPSQRPSITAVLECLGLMIQERQQQQLPLHLQQRPAASVQDVVVQPQTSQPSNVSVTRPVNASSMTSQTSGSSSIEVSHTATAPAVARGVQSVPGKAGDEPSNTVANAAGSSRSLSANDKAADAAAVHDKGVSLQGAVGSQQAAAQLEPSQFIDTL